MQAIKYKILQLRLASRSKKRLAGINKPYTVAQSFGMIITMDDNDKFVEATRWYQRLKQEGKSVHLLVYVPEKDINFADDRFMICSVRDFDLFGEIKEGSSLKDFLNREFDFLFHLDSRVDVVLESILALTKARCRVGKLQQHHRCYELTVVSGKSRTEVDGITEMFDYTKRMVTHG